MTDKDQSVIQHIRTNEGQLLHSITPIMNQTINRRNSKTLKLCDLLTSLKLQYKGISKTFPLSLTTKVVPRKWVSHQLTTTLLSICTQ